MADSASEGGAGREQALDEALDRLSEALEGSRERSESTEGDANDEADGRSAEDATDAEGDEPNEIQRVREAAKADAEELIRHPVDGVVEITPSDDGWTVGVEVIERRSIPDTQDIMGRYLLTVDESGTVAEFRRTDRYRRSEFSALREGGEFDASAGTAE
ncbi:gas vesicle protein GvpO [Halegenticoccus tardaugens]|uniref:gas vesicle protein GvpO n=1 Tax=Halegenticoccus tardaugens TaxID=2071624 RepID=UPI0013E98BB3|nr:gas vesicle protein GvpO [Halegenticoccus tardaugens]